MKKFLLAIFVVALVGCTGTRRTETISNVGVIRKPYIQQKVLARTYDFSVPVLMYHRICEMTPQESRNRFLHDLSVSPSDFEAQVKYLKDEGYNFLTVSEIEFALQNGYPLPSKSIALTLDDGYKDNFSEAMPILAKYGAKATIFMVTDNFGRADRLTWSNAREMLRKEISFQSHTKSHPDLTQLSDKQLNHELSDSKLILEQGLNIVVSSVAYPAGEFDKRVISMCKRTGYSAAWKKGGGPVEPQNASKPYELPRIRIHGRTDFAKFKKRVSSS